MCRADKPRSSGLSDHAKRQVLDVPGIGRSVLPRSFAVFTGDLGHVGVHDARARVRAFHFVPAAGTANGLHAP